MTNRRLLNQDESANESYFSYQDPTEEDQKWSTRLSTNNMYGRGYEDQDEKYVRAQRTEQLTKSLANQVLCGAMLQDENAKNESQSYYLEQFMKSQQNSELFLKAVKKDAPTHMLFKVAMDCYEDQNLPMCPVLIEVIDKKLQLMYGGKYLI